MSHCGYCERMEKRTFQDDDIKATIEKSFVFIDINIDESSKVLFNNTEYSNKEFVDYFDVDLFPSVLFFDKNREVIYTSRGYRKIKKFRKILKYIKTKSYKKVDFFDYKED